MRLTKEEIAKAKVLALQNQTRVTDNSLVFRSKVAAADYGINKVAFEPQIPTSVKGNALNPKMKRETVIIDVVVPDGRAASGEVTKTQCPAVGELELAAQGIGHQIQKETPAGWLVDLTGLLIGCDGTNYILVKQ